MDELHRRIVASIREQAEKKQIAVTHLPDRAGVARSHFWKVMHGATSPTLRWISKIAKALGVSALDLAQIERKIARSAELHVNPRPTSTSMAARAAESSGPQWRSSRRRRRKR